MEYRKLISFGKNSFVVSLPKSWITQNKMQKGDLIHITDNGQDLILSKKEGRKENIEKRKLINVDGKDLACVEREINSAYILNHRTIILKGKEIKTNLAELQKLFENLIALEVMEQTEDSLVAKDFLNMEKVSMQELIRKMDVVTRTMMKECFAEFSERNYRTINSRDRDVNRLYFLLYRTVLYNLDNPLNALKNFNLRAIDLVNILFSGYYLEGIADEVRRTARFCRLLKIDNEGEKKIQTFLKEINDYYSETMKAFYTRNVDLSLKLSNGKKQLNDQMDNLKKDYAHLEHLDNVLSRMRRMISFIYNIGRTVYQGYNYFDYVKEMNNLKVLDGGN